MRFSLNKTRFPVSWLWLFALGLVGKDYTNLGLGVADWRAEIGTAIRCCSIREAENCHLPTKWLANLGFQPMILSEWEMLNILAPRSTKRRWKTRLTQSQIVLEERGTGDILQLAQLHLPRWSYIRRIFDRRSLTSDICDSCTTSYYRSKIECPEQKKDWSWYWSIYSPQKPD